MKRSFILFFLLSLVCMSCRFTGGKRIRGNGVIISQNRSVGAFTGIDVRGGIDVYAKQDSVVSVKIDADENLMEYIHVSVDGNTLEIKEEKGYNLRSSKGIKVFVSGPSFKHFEASGSCDMYSENQIISVEPITIGLSGSCDVIMELKAPEIMVELSGSGNITLKGETKKFSVDGSGSTRIKCFEMLAENTNIEISGSGNAEVFASVKLDVEVSGSGDVKYKGNATVNKHISGSGSVRKVDNPAP